MAETMTIHPPFLTCSLLLLGIFFSIDLCTQVGDLGSAFQENTRTPRTVRTPSGSTMGLHFISHKTKSSNSGGFPKVTQMVFLILEFMFLPARQYCSTNRTSDHRWAPSNGVLVNSMFHFGQRKKLIGFDRGREPVFSPKNRLIFSHPIQEQ